MVNSRSKRKKLKIPNATGGTSSILEIEIYGNGKPTILDALKSQRNTSQPELALERGFQRMKESLEEVKDSIKKLEEEAIEKERWLATYTANVYRDLRGSCRFFLQKGCKNHRETLYSSKGKIVYVVGIPCNIYSYDTKRK